MSNTHRLIPETLPGLDRADSPGRRLVNSLRFRLILAVNLCLFGGLAIGVAVDYRHQVAVQLADKRAALEEEAKTLLPAVRALRHHGIDVVQQYLNAVCGKMQASTSPGHHIIVRVGQTMLHARSHSQWSSESARALDQAALTTQTQITIKGDTHVLASDTDQDVMVSVSESAAMVLSAARRQMVWRSVAIGAMGLAIALVIDAVLLRMVTQPIGRLVTAVRSIAGGHTGAQIGGFRATELSFLAGEINLMSQALADVERTRRTEMDKARRIQAHLQPCPVVCPGVEVACGTDSGAARIFMGSSPALKQRQRGYNPCRKVSPAIRDLRVPASASVPEVAPDRRAGYLLLRIRDYGRVGQES